jgi:pantoate--beta-alanine ligase
LTRDAGLLAEYNVDYVFAPTVEEIYPEGFSTYVTVEGLTDKLEGASRPGHFRGVTTVVTILLNIVRPDFAFFGQKDAQQAIVIKRVVRDLAFRTEVVVAPIVREESGLALSSRNSYLSDHDRRAATVLNRALMNAAAAFEDGERSSSRLLEIARATIDEESRAKLDYISINDGETLEPIDRIEENPALLSLAAFVGQTRLIDNIVLGKTKKQDAAGANG